MKSWRSHPLLAKYYVCSFCVTKVTRVNATYISLFCLKKSTFFKAHYWQFKENVLQEENKDFLPCSYPFSCIIAHKHIEGIGSIRQFFHSIASISCSTWSIYKKQIPRYQRMNWAGIRYRRKETSHTRKKFLLPGFERLLAVCICGLFPLVNLVFLTTSPHSEEDLHSRTKGSISFEKKTAEHLPPFPSSFLWRPCAMSEWGFDNWPPPWSSTENACWVI